MRRSPRLQRRLMDHARLAGPLPTELGRCRDLAILSVEWNSLSGDVPLEFGGECAMARSFELGPAAGVRPLPHVDGVGEFGYEEASAPPAGPRGLQPMSLIQI